MRGGGRKDIVGAVVCPRQTRDEERCCNLLSVPGLIAEDKTTPPSWVNMATGLWSRGAASRVGKRSWNYLSGKEGDVRALSRVCLPRGLIVNLQNTIDLKT